MATYKPVKTAKAMSRLADTWFTLRAERLAQKKILDEMEAEEKAAKAALMESLKQTSTTSIGGSKVAVTIEEEDVPRVEDWAKVQKYILKTKEFDLLQRRIGEAAVKARWEDGKQVPGVTAYPVDKLRHSAVK